LAALNVPLASRVRQIELSMERLRWLPELPPGPFIAVNLPSFRLWAFKAAGAPPVLATRVIVGKAVRTQTPLFIGTLRHIEFNPYWNVPPSILRAEIVPALLRDPDYLVKNDMEVVGPGVQTVSAATLAALRAGALRVRQRPGPRNSLGLVKFVFPNDADVYLHGTPARQLFGRARRDFSHGCVRVEDPLALARWVLRGRPAWTVERIEAAMAADAPQRVDLPRPLPVILFYVTAMAMPADGALHFAADIYGHDARLEQALAARSPR
jgi:murein L,D-transpeptidase YcbB/YkuD